MAEVALVLIDLQCAVDDASWGERNNLDAETNARALLERWRARGGLIVHVRHDSTEPRSTYRPGQPGHEFKPETAPLAGEIVVERTDGLTSEHRPADLGQRLRHDDERLRRMAQRRRPQVGLDAEGVEIRQRVEARACSVIEP